MPVHLGFLRRAKPRRRQGVTLVEVLVALAASVLVFGAAAEIYQTTSAMARRGILQDELFNDARAISNSITQDLQKFQPTAQEHWAAAEMDFATAGAKTSSTPVKVYTVPQPSAGDGAMTVALAEGAGKQPLFPSLSKNHVSSRITFHYAMEFNGLEPKWVDEVPAGQHPRLVKFEITAMPRPVAQVRGAEAPAVHLSGAVALVD